MSNTTSKPHPTVGRGTTALARVDTGKLARVDADLKKIAASLQQRYKAMDVAFTKVAAASGKDLLRAQKVHSAKGQRGEGFQKWIEDNCPFSVATAYNFIHLAQAAVKKPALLGMPLTEAYGKVGIKKPVAKGSRKTRSAKTIEGTATVIDGNFMTISTPLPGNSSIILRLRTRDAARYRQHGITKLVRLIKVALADCFKPAAPEPAGKKPPPRKHR